MDLHILETGAGSGHGAGALPKPRLTAGLPSCTLAYLPYLGASSTARSLLVRRSKAAWPSTIKYTIYFLKNPQHVKFILYLQKWSVNAFDTYLSKQINGN